MRKLVITENVTLDGIIDATGGWFDPLDTEVDRSDIVAANAEHTAAADALLVGRQTFEDFRGFWPHQHDDHTGVSAYLNTVAKYVVSSTMDDPQWANSTVLRGPLAEEVRALKTAPGQDIVCTGSVTLVRELVGTGLVDEYRLFVYPVALGAGARLFTSSVDLELIESRTFTSGVVLLRYRPAT